MSKQYLKISDTRTTSLGFSDMFSNHFQETNIETEYYLQGEWRKHTTSTTVKAALVDI